MGNSDINKYALEFLSSTWIITVACVIALIFTVLYVGHKMPSNKKEQYAKILSFLMIGFFVINHSFLFIIGKWELSKELPVHLCSISGLICCIIMFLPKSQRQFPFEFLFYCGIIGGVQAILTPLIDDYGGYNFFYIQFFFKHAMIIAFPIYLRNNIEMKLTKYSWVKTFFTLNILMIILIQINNLLGSNYMYVNVPPAVDNPMVIGEWPTYLYWWEVFVLILILIVFFFGKPKNFENNN
ncbi:MAG: TIGR02206 family membrane protein [Bacteroidetes bacterium]|nr:MAG: TIGR02206 family membrane protein [Bacteroidota bacterium]